MTKKVFAVVLKEANETVERKIMDNYPKMHQYTDTFYLVACGPDVLAKDIAVSVGIKGEGRVESASGVVFKLNTVYSGYTERTLWEWLSSVEDE